MFQLLPKNQWFKTYFSEVPSFSRSLLVGYLGAFPRKGWLTLVVSPWVKSEVLSSSIFGEMGIDGYRWVRETGWTLGSLDIFGFFGYWTPDVGLVAARRARTPDVAD